MFYNCINVSIAVWFILMCYLQYIWFVLQLSINACTQSNMYVKKIGQTFGALLHHLAQYSGFLVANIRIDVCIFVEYRDHVLWKCATSVEMNSVIVKQSLPN